MSTAFIEELQERFSLSRDSPSGLIYNQDVKVGNGRVMFKTGDVAGSLNNQGYWRVSINNRRLLAHRVVWMLHTNITIESTSVIDHIDGNKTCNFIENLRLTACKTNSQNCGISKNNTSGITGICFDNSRLAWLATWKQNGKTRFKRFTLKEYSNKAKDLAIEYRQEKLLHLNSLGENYTDRHIYAY